MHPDLIPDNPYLLLTPGPLSTTKTVRAALLRDWCTWDSDYNQIVQSIRTELATLAGTLEDITCTLMQGSGTFSVESVISSCLPEDGTLLVLCNGAYGERIVKIAMANRINVIAQDSGELMPPDLDQLRMNLKAEGSITHVAVVHCETTTGMLNPIREIGKVVKEFGKTFIVDAMSSFGGIPIDMQEIEANVLISSANKCIQGVPGFGFILADLETMQTAQGRARSLSLNLYDQWDAMEKGRGKWRFTSPTHVVRAFAQALTELKKEGLEHRAERYRTNHRVLVDGMRNLGFETLLPDYLQSPFITSFLSPDKVGYSFPVFYEAVKRQGFVLYPGKVTQAETFRIGNIGDVYPEDMERLVQVISKVVSF